MSRTRLTYANVVSTLALVVAMSTGGAYAASQITTSQLANGAVTTPKLRDAAVTTAKLATNSVTRNKLTDGAVGSPEIAAGAVTAQKIRSGAVNSAKVTDGSLGTADITDESLTGDDIADGLIRGADIWNGSIAADDLQVWARAPVAFAHVHANGWVVYGSAEFTDEKVARAMQEDGTTPRAGVYCIRDLEYAPNAVSVTGSMYQVGPTIPNAVIGKGDGCPEGTQVTVYTHMVQAGTLTLTDGAFFFNGWP